MSIVSDTFATLINRLWYAMPLIECPDGKLRNLQAGDNLGNPALPSGAATAALQTALDGTIRHATTPTKADLATGAIEVNRRGSTFVACSARHRRRLDLTVLAAGTGIATGVASLAEGPCDALRTDTDNLVVYAQPPERALIASQSGADWTGAAGWSRVGNVWTHAAGGGTGDLEITPSGISQIGVGETYCVVYTLVWSAGTSLTEKLGTGAGTARSSSATFVKLITAATNGKIIFTPTNDAACSIDVSTVYVIPPTAPLTAGVYEAESAINVVAVAAAATPTTPHTTAKLYGYWLRRAGAVELT